jgi:ribosomal protein S18 acetylase RimI-like enzyme
MSRPLLSLRAATIHDLDWLVWLEQSPANATFLCAWSPDRHAAALRDPDKAYLVFESIDGRRCGFAILAGLRSPTHAVELVRLAVDPPGEGLGSAALDGLIRHVFEDLRAFRLFLDVFADNARARRAYGRHGFVDDEILPDAARRQDGSTGTLVVMGLTADRAGKVAGINL